MYFGYSLRVYAGGWTCLHLLVESRDRVPDLAGGRESSRDTNSEVRTDFPSGYNRHDKSSFPSSIHVIDIISPDRLACLSPSPTVLKFDGHRKHCHRFSFETIRTYRILHTRKGSIFLLKCETTILSSS